ncbi:MAG: (Fe-S)-binding protein, partial [Deltaproteobacteria bacterium]|nr:(Fe-S)-binding protein [Deltaproteobacteria bacterium]
MNPTITSVLLAFFFGWFFWQLYGRFGALAKMASEGRWDRPWRRLGLVFSIGLGQSKLVGPRKERRAGVMHAFIFWGALLVGLREMILMGEGFVEGFQELLPGLGADSPLAYGYVALVNGAELAVAYMVGVALYRRLVKRYARLDLNWQGIYVLLFIMGIVTTDLAYDAVRYALAAQGGAVHLLQSPVWGSEVDWAPVSRLLAGLVSGLGADWLDGLRQGLFWGHLVIMLSFLNVLPNTKQFHELTALPNVFFGALNRPHAPIPRLDLEDEQAWEAGAVGVNRLEQLTWKQGLDFLSCTECGRCYDSCPTYLTGKPLTQKWFNQSLLAYFKEEQANLLKTGKAGEAKTLVGDVISPDTLWACTTCRACEEACPVSIEHVPRVIGMRQGQTLMGEAYPPEMANAFKGLERNGNPWGIGYDQRADWARDEPVTILDGPVTEEVEVVMWVGCMG